MRAVEKERVRSLVAESGLPRRRALGQLGLARSTYYRWLGRQTAGRLEDARGGSRLPWNKLKSEEEAVVLCEARAAPELSPRQLALRITDCEGWYVSESTVYRVLKREGLVKPAEVVGFKAGREYHRKTNGPNGLWATDCATSR
ncbi:MAG: helix-turn-helix domain-containing protein [Dehalococcoidia bacterium]